MGSLHSPGLPRRTLHWAVVAALLGVSWCLALSGVWDKSATFDEILHLTAGCCYWAHDDYRLHPENGNLPQRWAALPVLACGFTLPTTDQETWRHSNVARLGQQFFYESGNDADLLLFRGRMVAALLGVAVGVVVYAWSRTLFGPAAGLLSLALATFCPTMLANLPLVTSETAVTLFFSLAAWGWWTVLHRATPLTVLASTLATAGLLLSKMSGLFFLLMALLLLLLRVLAGRPWVIGFRGERVVRSGGWQLLLGLGLGAVHGAVAVAVIWAAFGFRYSAMAPGRTTQDDRLGHPWESVLSGGGLELKAVEFARDHQLLPEAYLYGLAYISTTTQTRNAFLNGETYEDGRLLFFPYCLLVKTPLPLFALVGLGLGALALSSRGEKPAGGAGACWYETLPLMVLVGVYWALAFSSVRNMGHRYLMPTYPPLFILAGPAVFWLSRQGLPSIRVFPGSLGRLPGLLVPLLLLLFAGESLATWPNYLGYFNCIAGGPRQGYRHLVDSSLDWGQDLPALARWLRKRDLPSRDTPVYLSYFGSALPDYYGIRAKRLPSFFPVSRSGWPMQLTGGVYCISATMLQGVYLPEFRGPWTPKREEAYRWLCDCLKEAEQGRTTPEGRKKLFQVRGLADWEFLFRQYEEASFARLCAVLRHREPDDRAGCSILIYRLSPEEVALALTGPVP